MASYVKEAWELHISCGEKAQLFLAPHEKVSSVLGALRNYKSRSVQSFLGFGMVEMAQELKAKTFKWKYDPVTKELTIWLESKAVSNGTFRILGESHA